MRIVHTEWAREQMSLRTVQATRFCQRRWRRLRAALSAVKQPTDCRPAVCPSPVFYSRLTGHCPSYPADSRASTELDVCGPDRRRRMIYQSLLAGQRLGGFLAGHSIKACVLFPRPPICIVRRSVGVRYYDSRCDETWNNTGHWNNHRMILLAYVWCQQPCLFLSCPCNCLVEQTASYYSSSSKPDTF